MTGDSAAAEVGVLTDVDVRGMVATLQPEWSVDAIERSPHGTDFVAMLSVRPSAGDRARDVVLKATTADFVAPTIARSEPRFLELVSRETSIPVPDVFGYCDYHEEYPAPFYLIEHVEGENYENRSGDLSPLGRERVLREAGRNLAELHELGPIPSVGRVGVHDGDLAVLDTDDHPRHDDFRDWLLADCEETLDAIADGGWFPELADDADRFADLVPDLRAFLRDSVPRLPEPDPPRYCHWDYRYGNLLLEPETGRTRAVLDWANLLAGDPVYNLAKAEFHLLKPVVGNDIRTATLRDIFLTAYADARTDWSLDRTARERLVLYRLPCRVDAMACLPLWYRDATPEERDDRAAELRRFAARYV
ncbi:phosphotransferase [Halobacteria archaeon AArc-m2/3/4]|uniref:Phosphotransferase n=1 Tax=Natronoglomus mannanivorans TaxID=2979990 RepID=A0ABT2QEP0_9EURY|nr:phosphotransferase [Halobacteria archaeon AArc-m2/3/4]